MTSEPTGSAPDDSLVEETWRDALVNGHRGRWSFLPRDPRCLVCRQPFEGVGGAALRLLTGFRPSRNSPNMCNVCEDVFPAGGAEIDVVVLFADMRGSTALGTQLGSSEYASLLNRFYREASQVLLAGAAWIDKLVGDEVMALYIPAMGSDYRTRAVGAAVRLLQAFGYRRGEQPWLQVGVGVNAGPAFVGKVGAAGVQQVTALGDTVNLAARLQSQAAPGELLIGNDLYSSVNEQYPGAEPRSLTVKGHDDEVLVHVLRPAEL